MTVESEKSKRMRAKTLIDYVPADLLDDFLWTVQQYAAEGMDKA